MKLKRNKLRFMRVAKPSCEASQSTTKGYSKDPCHDLEWTNQITECPVYRPSIHEFEDPLEFIQKIMPEASKYGICKILPPLVSTIPSGVVMTKEKPGFRFTPKVQPLRVARWTKNDKTTFLISGKSYTLRDFEVMANRVSANKHCLSGCLPSAYLEREFWHELMCHGKGTVEYGVNVDGSAFSSSFNDQLANSKWNLKKLPRLQRSPLRLVENAIPGVTDPMLYIGMLFSMFAWHVEDHYLYSINYHHCGAPKTWYGVPGTKAFEFEKVVQNHVYSREIVSMDGGADGAFELLAEKTTMFPPNILLQNRVPVYRTTQLPGEFVITFPRAYHAGFSHGFNCGEAVNFAASDWFPFGEAANERYILLLRPPIIPYEEILCKEAMLLSSNPPTKTQHYDNFCIKSSFASLIRKHENSLLWLKNFDDSLNISPDFKGTVSCSLCKHDCYVAHVSCNCRSDPICVFHDMELSECCCGNERVVSVRENLGEMKEVAKMFEKEAATPVKRKKKRGKTGSSPSARKKQTRASQRSKETKRNGRKRGSQCHFRRSKIAR